MASKKEDIKTDVRLLTQYFGANYTQLQGLIRLADTKANIIIALIGVILSTFFNFLISKDTTSMWQAVVIITFFFLSGMFAIRTLYPRKSPKSKHMSLLYYKNAAEINADKIAHDMITKDKKEAIVKDFTNNIKQISIILDKKFTQLRYAYLFFCLGILLKILFEFINWAG